MLASCRGTWARHWHHAWHMGGAPYYSQRDYNGLHRRVQGKGCILSTGIRWESVKRLRLRWTLRDGMPGRETGDKHLRKTCWPTEWRVGMWGISICQSTAWRFCMKWTREKLWGAYDGVGTCTHWGAVGGFSTPIAQSDPGSFDYTGGCVEKNLGTIGITKNANSQLERPLRSYRCKEHTFGLHGRRRGWDDLRE